MLQYVAWGFSAVCALMAAGAFAAVGWQIGLHVCSYRVKLQVVRK
jgi:hypothetical protein